MMKGEGDVNVPGVLVDFSVAPLGSLQKQKTGQIYSHFHKEMYQVFFCLWTFAYAVFCTMCQLSLCLANSCFFFRAHVA